MGCVRGGVLGRGKVGPVEGTSGGRTRSGRDVRELRDGTGREPEVPDLIVDSALLVVLPMRFRGWGQGEFDPSSSWTGEIYETSRAVSQKLLLWGV